MDLKGEQVLPTLGGNQNMAIINEAGLYKLIMRSNKPIAQKFQEYRLGPDKTLELLKTLVLYLSLSIK